MNKIKQFDKATLKSLRSELDAVLAKFEKKVGVEIKSGGIKFSSTTCTITLEAKVAGAQDKTVAALELLTEFKENDIIRINNLGEVKLVGFKTKNRKYPYIVETVHTGKRYKLSEKQIIDRISIV
jgi:hypothetical protein